MKGTELKHEPVGAQIGKEAEAMNNELESTYALLVRSEDKSRSIMESFVFSLIALSGFVAVWQFAEQATSLPLARVQAVTREYQQAKPLAS